MGIINGILGLLLAGIGIIVCLPFLPIVQGFTNTTNPALMASLNSSGMVDTPFAPIMHLWPIWGLFLIMVCVLIIVVSMSKQS